MRIGSLCSGYGGLDMAAEWVLGAAVVWHAENAVAPARILEARWPGVPNHGDLTRIDWRAIEPVDVLTAGYPCQPFALAGRRKGADDVRHLWPYVRAAIRHLRPRLTILENVAGHRSLGFDRVLGDLAEDGFNAVWTSVRASDVGAAHGRERLFVCATPHAIESRSQGPQSARRHELSGWRDRSIVADTGGEEQPRWSRLCADDETGLWRARSGDGGNDAGFDWSDYRPAIDRWAAVVGRRPPRPMVKGRLGGRSISARFIEWHMGLPEGWVTDVQGLNREQQITALGNGVVPQQAAAAICELLSVDCVVAA